MLAERFKGVRLVECVHMWFPLALAAAFLYAWMWIFARMSRGVNSGIVTASTALWGPPLFLWMLTQVDYPWGEWWWQLYMLWIILCLSLTLRLLTVASQKSLVTVINPLAALSTLSALFVSVAFFERTFIELHIVGIAIITGGLLLLYHGQWRAWCSPWTWAALFGVLILGVNVAIIKEILVLFPHPIAIIAVDATVVFVVNAVLAGPAWFRLRISNRMLLLLVIFSATTLIQDTLTLWALQLGPAPHVVAVKRTSILIAAALSYFVLHEREQPLPKLLLASVVVVLGVVLLTV